MRTEMRLFTEDAIRIDDCIYFLGRDVNLLFCLDLLSGRLSVLGKIPDYGPQSTRLGCRIIQTEDGVLIEPLCTNTIWKYSISMRKWSATSIAPIEGIHSYLRTAYVLDRKILMWGGYYPALVIYDLDEGTIEYKDDIFRKKKNPMSDLYFRGNPVCVGNEIYLASCIDNTIMRFNIESYEHEWIEVGNKNNRYSGICFDGNDFWIAPRSTGSVVKWDGGSITYEYDTNIGMVNEKAIFFDIIKKGDVFLIPALVGAHFGSLIINGDGSITQVNDRYTFYKIGENGEILYQTHEGKLVYIDSFGSKKEYELQLGMIRSDNRYQEDGMDLSKYFSCICRDEGIACEGIEADLQGWLTFL